MTRALSALVFVLAFAAFATATIPAKFALGLTRGEEVVIAATAATGTIWNAQIQNLRINGLRAANARLRLDPFSLVTGTQRLDISSTIGTAVLTMGELEGTEHARVSIAASELGLPFINEGAVRLDDVTLLFRDGECGAAAGRIMASASSMVSGNLELEGDVRCGNKAAVVNLSGRNADLEIALALRIEAGGSYVSELRVRNALPSRLAALRIAGFTQQGGDLVRIDQGRLGS